MKPTRPALALVGLLAAGLAASTISTASAVDPVSAHLQRPLAGIDSGTFPARRSRWATATTADRERRHCRVRSRP